MEGDGPEIARVQAAGDRGAAGRPVPGAQGLDLSRAHARRQYRVGRVEASARRRTRAAVTKGMSQATQTTGAGEATTAV